MAMATRNSVAGDLGTRKSMAWNHESMIHEIKGWPKLAPPTAGPERAPGNQWLCPRTSMDGPMTSMAWAWEYKYNGCAPGGHRKSKQGNQVKGWELNQEINGRGQGT